MLCSLVSRISDDGRSPETQQLSVLYIIVITLQHLHVKSFHGIEYFKTIASWKLKDAGYTTSQRSEWQGYN
jgi:hypothetical protein